MAEPKVYYSCSPHDERFTHTELDTAVEEYLSYFDPPLPTTVMVRRYEPKTITAEEANSWAHDLLGQLIEQVDEEYGDPEEPTECESSWIALMRETVGNILRGYTVWTCEEVKPATVVDTAAWIRQHHPQWLEEEKIKREVERLEAGDKSHGGQDG